MHQTVIATLHQAIIFAKAAMILRMIHHKSAFAGTFHGGCVECAIPSTPLQFVCMIEHGADVIPKKTVNGISRSSECLYVAVPSLFLA
jgi:hypothetical protein